MSAWLLLLSLCGGVASAGELADGVDAFDQGHLDEAIHAWESAPAPRSAAIHYNLGLAYYRKGEVGRAIASWRTAKLLRPRSGDISHNLAVARSKIPSAPDPVGAPVSWMEILSLSELMGLALLLLGAGSVGVWRVRDDRPGAWRGAAVAGALGTAAGLVAAWGAYALDEHPVAVVVDGEAVLRDAAAVQAAEIGALVEGSEVRVERVLGDFFLVRAVDGSGGWIPASHAVVVDPRIDAIAPPRSSQGRPPG